MSYTVYADSRDLSREEWLEARRSGIGGSDAGAIMGLHPYKGQFGVWADKKGYSEAVEDNEAMRQGRDLEDYAARRFAEKTGLAVRREYGMLRSNEHSFMVANIDRRIRGRKAGLECKCSKDIYLKRWRNGDMPIEYYCQCLHYMAVTGWDTWYLVAVIALTEVLVFKICRGEAEEEEGVDHYLADAQDDIDRLTEREGIFWARYIEGGDMPPPDALPETGRVLNGMWDGEDGSWMGADSTQDAMLDELLALRSQKKALEKQIAQIENTLKADMRDNVELRGTSALVTWKPQQQRRLSEKKLKELYPMVDIGKCKEEIETRRFCVRTEEEIDG